MTQTVKKYKRHEYSMSSFFTLRDKHVIRITESQRKSSHARTVIFLTSFILNKKRWNVIVHHVISRDSWDLLSKQSVDLFLDPVSWIRSITVGWSLKYKAGDVSHRLKVIEQLVDVVRNRRRRWILFLQILFKQPANSCDNNICQFFGQSLCAVN